MSDYNKLPRLSDDGLHTENVTKTSSHFSLGQFRLVDTATSTKATGSRLVVGTHQGTDLRLNDPSVSRYHCEVSSLPTGAVEIRDLGSRNGTRVNGVWIEKAVVHRTATIQVGRTTLELHPAHESTVIRISEASRFGDLVGTSEPMRRAYYLLEAASKSNATCLVTGESGTGKELAALAIHDHSDRQKGPFVVVDCGSLPNELIASELFGHKKGAFTGAMEDRVGAFESAHGGTIFLDEIGELPIAAQPQLLRVLESRTITRVGETHPRQVDVRVVAATHRDLRECVNQESFREDLYYRLAVLTIQMPPLRERREDMRALIGALADKLGVDVETHKGLLASEVIDELARRPWPGNIRQLRNEVERRAANIPQTDSSSTAIAHQLSIDTGKPLKELRQAILADLEGSYLRSLLEQTQGNVSAVADRAGISRMQVYRLMQKYKIREG